MNHPTPPRRKTQTTKQNPQNAVTKKSPQESLATVFKVKVYCSQIIQFSVTPCTLEERDPFTHCKDVAYCFFETVLSFVIIIRKNMKFHMLP